MRFRTALIFIVVLVGAVFGLQPLMTWIVERSMAQGQMPSDFVKAVFMASILYREFWWIIVPAIVVFFLLIATITAVIRHFRKKGKSKASASATAQ